MRWTLSLAAALMSFSAAAGAAPTYPFHIPAGSLQSALVTIGSTAGVTIGVTDRSIASEPVPALDGRFAVVKALRHLLAGSDAAFVQIDSVTFQIISRARPAARSKPVVTGGSISDGMILVTGSKRAALLSDYAGSVSMVDTSALQPNRTMHGSDALVEQLPILASTHLGPGRDKLFIRGIADSSFAGPTQATVGEYLGDIRLNYNAPDPDLALYDIRSVEVLEGPQGTLYGAGSLGGIIRLEPELPDLSHASLTVSAGGALTAHGGPSGDAEAVGNLPLINGKLALRVVAYGSEDGGYIDDPSRGLRDIDRTFTRGARATLRWRPRDDWTVDAGGVVQDINSRDGQYAERGLPPLTHASVVRQPFDNDYGLASLVLRHATGATSLVSASSLVSHELTTGYDASASAVVPLRYASQDTISIWTNETRLAHQGPRKLSWVAGVEILHSEDRLTRSLGAPNMPSPISGTRNVVEQASVYGEATASVLPNWSITGGGRLAYTRQVGEVLDQPGHHSEPDRHGVSALPSVGLLWKPEGRVAIYARYQEGYRPGGLSVLATGTQRFEGDSVATWELGGRLGGTGDRFSGAIAASYAHWEDIQADLVDASGLPYTANIGTGRVLGLELHATWRPLAGARLEAALFANKSRLAHPAPAFAGEDDATLPNVPALLSRIGATYAVNIAGHAVNLTASARYVGRSRLGVGQLLDQRQGGYLDTAAGGSIELKRITASLDATNLLDHRGNVFALGNPFGVLARRQTTPLRPRTLRLGFAARF